MRRKKNQSSRGFTLLEVLIAVLIVGIIATAAIPLLGSYTEKAREAREEANLQIKRAAQDRYEQDHKAGLGLVYNPEANTLNEYGIASAQGPSAQLLLPTDVNGNVMGDPVTASPGPFSHGPYLAQLPPEPASVLLATPTIFKLPLYAKQSVVAFFTKLAPGKYSATVFAIKNTDFFTGSVKTQPSVQAYAPGYTELVDLSGLPPDEIVTIEGPVDEAMMPNVAIPFLRALSGAYGKCLELEKRTGLWKPGPFPYSNLLGATEDWNEENVNYATAAEHNANHVKFKGQKEFFELPVEFSAFLTAEIAFGAVNDIVAAMAKKYPNDPEKADLGIIFYSWHSYESMVRAKDLISPKTWNASAIREEWDAALDSATTDLAAVLRRTKTFGVQVTESDATIIEKARKTTGNLAERLLESSQMAAVTRHRDKAAAAAVKLGVPVTSASRLGERMYGSTVENPLPLLPSTDLAAIMRNPTDAKIDQAASDMRDQIIHDEPILVERIQAFAAFHGRRLSQVTSESLQTLENGMRQRRDAVFDADRNPKLSHMLWVTPSLANEGIQRVHPDRLSSYKRGMGSKVGRLPEMLRALEYNIKISVSEG